jgi:NTE family protein
MSSPAPQRKFGLVLPAGGARAAYQVGVIRYIAKNFPEFKPTIFTGISAGSINACYLAQGEPFPLAAQQLGHLWQRLEFNQVIRTNFKSIFSMGTRWMYDMFLSKVTRKLLLKSLLDASPLAATLLAHIHFWKISRAIRSGAVDGLAVTATNYHDGTTTVFFDSNQPITPWRREQRYSIRTAIRMRHIMASCSIPILFEPVRIGDFLYGDGALRFNFPFSPSIHLGATDILAIGIRCPTPENNLGFRPDHVGLGFVAGSVLNSIFLDSIESDYETMNRLNASLDKNTFRQINSTLLRPSRDLGGLAKHFFNEVPYHFRQLLRSTANPDELGDLLSYLMFSPGYVNALMDLGMEDAAKQHSQIEAFLLASDQRVALAKT